MVDSYSILPNGKQGLFFKNAIDFDLRNPDLAKKACFESKIKHAQIALLYKRKPKIFEPNNNLAWTAINFVATSINITLNKKLLCSMYEVEGMDLSIVHCLKSAGSEERCARLALLADALSKYIECHYKFYLDDSCFWEKEDLEFALDMFMDGAYLMAANFEPLVSAGKNRISEAALEKVRLSQERKNICLDRRQEILARHPNHSNTAIASIIHKELKEDLCITVKTIQGYFKGL